MTPFERAPKRQKALAFIRSEIAGRRGFPTMQAIADHMGWKNCHSARDCLRTLAALDGMLDQHVIDGQLRFTISEKGKAYETV
jgi:hypothetical protein